MEEIFSSCETNGDNKITTSNIIEACRMNYNLNDELRETLLNKLDPDNVDKAYSKEDLFFIFKDWIMCKKLPNEPKYSFTPVNDTSTPVTSRPRRHYKKNICLPQALFNEELLNTNEVDTEESARGSCLSSSQRLYYQKSRLESRLETTERHASSLERRYESMTNMCERQKLEIERLKQELKGYRDTEQSMEEVNEQMSKVQMEIYAKFATDMSSMKSHIEKLESDVENLNHDLSTSGEKITKLELENASLTKRNEELEQYLFEKEKIIEDMLYEVNSLKGNIAVQRQAVSALIEENSALKSELEEIKANAPCNIQNMGIPLCDELPSEMFIALPDDSSLSDSVFHPSKERSLVSIQCQTELFKSTEGSQIDASVQLVSAECQTDVPVKLVSTKCQTDVPAKLVSTKCQTDVPLKLVSKECQTNIPAQLVSAECQANISEQFESAEWNNNVSPHLMSTNCQMTNISEQLNTSANHEKYLSVTLYRWIKILLRLILNKFLDALGLFVIFLIFCTLLLCMLVIVCQNGQCMPHLRYSKPPPV